MMHRVLRLGHARHVSKYLKRLVPGMFLQELCARPGAIGAICPSSPFLAACMARQVAHCHDGLIVELGAGTGVVTQALLDQGLPPERLLVIEFSITFVQRLRKRFPGVNIVHGSAADLCAIMPADAKVSAIVSSLPLCSLPDAIMQQILHQWQFLLRDDGIAVQFTYNLRRPKWRKHIVARQTGSKIVWANLPPAQVSTFTYESPRLLPTHHEHPSAEHPR